MVRLEKVLYEQVMNSNLIQGVRKISTPQKWFPVNPLEHVRMDYQRWWNSPFGKLFGPFIRWFNKIEMKYQVDIFRQQGLTPEDRFLHSDKDLRRNVLFEHIMRESMHPYHWILKSRRRERWCRIDYALPGFWAPQYLRAENNSQTFIELSKLERQWFAFQHDNYYSDMTPQPHHSIIGKLIPMEWLMNFGSLRDEAYGRYFMNERDDMWIEEQILKQTRDRQRFPFDLTTVEGKRKFEEHIVDYNEGAPGALAPFGEKFDFKAYYAELGV